MLKGCIFLVTGASDGIGLHTAKELHRKGATVYLHGRRVNFIRSKWTLPDHKFTYLHVKTSLSSRNAKKLDDIARSLTSQGEAPVYWFVADFSVLDSVRDMAQHVKRTLGGERLKTLINNAGFFENRGRRVTQDGLEMTWQVNVASPYLLTSLLLDCIQQRIVNVASISAASHIDFGNLQQVRCSGASDMD